jgi:hypothetical protein
MGETDINEQIAKLQQELKKSYVQRDMEANQCGQTPIRPEDLSLRDRCAAQLREASAAAERRERLLELVCLLDANPAVARILDLLERPL